VGRDRRPTLADVAASAGVSVPLASIVMRDAPGASTASRRRVMEAAETLGYRPDARARLLRAGHSRLIGVTFDVQQAFHGDLISGLYSAADVAGYELTLSAVTPGRGEERAVSSLLQDRCEALILLGPTIATGALAELSTQLPVVVVARIVKDQGIDVVRTDDNEGLQQAVDHLVALGHRRIAHIDGGRAAGAAERRRGYRLAMKRNGLAGGIRIMPGGLSEDSGATAAHRLLSDALRPTAVAAFNDRCALGVLDVARQAGLSIPDDLSVVGFDDSSIARLAHINLTTVAQDAATMATLSISRALSRVHQEQLQEKQVVIRPKLVVRGTTGRASAIVT
jgi:DNA-binding LacI/PurR family transcriptional regulator